MKTKHSDYVLPRTTTMFGDRAFSVTGPKVWNGLPESVRDANTSDISLNIFFRLVKHLLWKLNQTQPRKIYL